MVQPQLRVLITGASRGLGRALVEALSTKHSLIVTSRSTEAMRTYLDKLECSYQVVPTVVPSADSSCPPAAGTPNGTFANGASPDSALGPALDPLLDPDPATTVTVVPGDIAVEQTWRALVETARKKWGPHLPDVVIHNAGQVEPLTRIRAADFSDFRRAFDVNFFSAAGLTSALLRHLSAPDPPRTTGVPSLSGTTRSVRPLFLFISTAAATEKFAAKGLSPYCSSKAALLQFARVLSAEEGNNLTAFSLGPGVLDTDMQTVIRDFGRENPGVADEGFVEFVTELKASGKIRQSGEVVSVLEALLERYFGDGRVDANVEEGGVVAEGRGESLREVLQGRYLELEQLRGILSGSVGG